MLTDYVPWFHEHVNICSHRRTRSRCRSGSGKECCTRTQIRISINLKQWIEVGGPQGAPGCYAPYQRCRSLNTTSCLATSRTDLKQAAGTANENQRDSYLTVPDPRLCCEPSISRKAARWKFAQPCHAGGGALFLSLLSLYGR